MIDYGLQRTFVDELDPIPKQKTAGWNPVPGAILTHHQFADDIVHRSGIPLQQRHPVRVPRLDYLNVRRYLSQLVPNRCYVLQVGGV